MGSSKNAAKRMGASRAAGARILGAFRDIQRGGVLNFLQSLNLSELAGRAAADVFLSFTDLLCPAGGTIDEAIARQAFLETIVDFADQGMVAIEDLTVAQMGDFFTGFVTHSVEARLINDIGTRIVAIPANPADVQRIQDVLRDFIHGCARDAFGSNSGDVQGLSDDEVRERIDQIYEATFSLLCTYTG